MEKNTFIDPLAFRGGTKYYQMSQPIDISLNTSQPDDPDQALVMAVLSPSSCYTSTVGLQNPMHPIHRTDLHQHNYYELIYVRRGDMFQKIEDRRHLYKEGSLCLLNHHVRHAEEYQTAFQCAFVAISDPLMRDLIPDPSRCYFQQEYLREHAMIRDMVAHEDREAGKGREYIDFIPRGENCEGTAAMRSRFEALYDCFLNPGPGSTFRIKSILSEIFGALCDTSFYNTIPIRLGTKKESMLFDEITRIMEERKGRATRSELSELLHYDGSYLNLIVQKYTGMSIFSYGNSICMKEAARLLSETDHSVQEISEELHFSNRTHFYKLFEDYWHMTPRRYRLQLSDSSHKKNSGKEK